MTEVGWGSKLVGVQKNVVIQGTGIYHIRSHTSTKVLAASLREDYF
jgi:hypothetical protein